MNKKIAMFPGSFDPPTSGHLDIMKRASSMFEKLYVVIAENKKKKCLFSNLERKQLIMQLVALQKNIEVVIYDGLVVDFAKENNVGVMIRGVRSAEDYSYESELAGINRMIYPELDVVFFQADPKYSFVSSSAVKELAFYGADISEMVPEQVIKALSVKDKLLT